MRSLSRKISAFLVIVTLLFTSSLALGNEIEGEKNELLPPEDGGPVETLSPETDLGEPAADEQTNGFTNPEEIPTPATPESSSETESSVSDNNQATESQDAPAAASEEPVSNDATGSSDSSQAEETVPSTPVEPVSNDVSVFSAPAQVEEANQPASETIPGQNSDAPVLPENDPSPTDHAPLTDPVPETKQGPSPETNGVESSTDPNLISDAGISEQVQSENNLSLPEDGTPATTEEKEENISEPVEEITPSEIVPAEDTSSMPDGEDVLPAAPETVASVQEYISLTSEDSFPPTDALSVSEEISTDVLPAGSAIPTEGTEGFVYRMYKTVLQREPEEQGFRFWVDGLNSGRLTAAEVVSGFFGSPEYQDKYKSSDDTVQDFYQVVLNRAPDPEGYSFWKKFLDAGMTTDVMIYGFMRSPEFSSLARQYGITPGSITLTDPRDQNYERTAFVSRLYRNCLQRNPDKGGLRFWCNLLNQGLTGSEIAESFVFSKEYKNTRADNNAFVEMLYNTMLGRASDAQGFSFWTKKLNYADSRERVVNQFVFSQEFRGQCDKAQIQIGTPSAEPDDTEEWRYNIEVLRLCNQARTAAGLPTLYTREDLLWDLAMDRAEEITEQFAHTRPDGTPWSTLFEKRGFGGYAGENLAGGQTSPLEVFNAWMNSPGHRANILNVNYTYLATGYVYDPGAATYCAEGNYTGKYVSFKHYWAQSFCNKSVPIN